MNDFFCLAQDIGMGSNKIYGPSGGVIIQSTVSTNTGRKKSTSIGLRSRKPPTNVQIDGMSFYVGNDAHDWGRPVENLDYDRMTGVPETRAITYATISQYIEKFGPITKSLYYVVGLPLEPLSGDQSTNNTNSVRQWLRGHHSWEADGKLYAINIEDVKIASQPVGALFDFLLDENCQFIPERRSIFSQEIGIIYIGFNTIEILTVKDRTPVHTMSEGKRLGVRRLLELMSMNELFTLGELDALLRNGALDTSATLPVWAREILGQIEKIWENRWRRFAQIIVVGGGAVLLKDVLMKRFSGKIYFPDDPIQSISKGLYKLGVLHMSK